MKKFKKLSPFIFEFCFWEDPPHQSTGPQPIPKCISLKCIFPKCIYPKCISAKCIRLACLLSFASLFSGKPRSNFHLSGHFPVAATFLNRADSGGASSVENSFISLAGRSPETPPFVVLASRCPEVECTKP